MATLSAAELRKYEWRIPTFLERLASGTFFTSANTEVKLSYTGDDLESRLRNDTSRAINKIVFADTSGTEYRLHDILKDSGFGGGAQPLRREEAALELFRQRILIAQHEHASEYVPVVIGDACYDVVDLRGTEGTPKSDFHLVDTQGKDAVWISHKHGRSPRGFQQWGGCSQRVEPRIYAHAETQDFAARVRGTVFQAGLTIAASIGDANLRHLAVYGNSFGEAYGPNNVQLVIQGDPELAANTANLHYDIVSFQVHHNGDEMPEDYRPTFMAMYRGDRNDFGVTNCRVGISPRKARLITSWVDDEPSSEPHSAP